jgi:hypothetical protein
VAVKGGRGVAIRILLPTSLPRERLDPLALEIRVRGYEEDSTRQALTDDERDHGGSISSGSFQALDQLLHFPDLDILLGLVGLGVAHLDWRRRFKRKIS